MNGVKDWRYLQRSKVNHAIDIGVSLEDLVESCLFGDIELHEFGSLAGDELDAVDHLIGRVVEIVGNDNLVAGVQEGQGSEGANVAGSTGTSVSSYALKTMS